MTPTIVSGAVSTLTDVGRDEAWLQGWLKEQPSRLGLGELSVEPAPSTEPADGTFLARQGERCFSVDVQLGELDATHGFGVLDAWARNRARQPERDHVAVLVTETCGDRYRTTLETLAKHLPLVVIELAVWRGESEALVIPHIALASEGVRLGPVPASAAAGALSRAKAAVKSTTPTTLAPSETARTEPKAKGEGAAPKTEGTATATDAAATPTDKDDTGVADPWGLPRKEPEAAPTANGSRLLTKFST
jgi:hypothetical protein